MTEITYGELLLIITALWVLVRAAVTVKTNRFSLKREAQLLMVYICIIVIARIVYFPWHHVSGHIDTLKFDSSKIRPPWFNLVPFVHLFEVYDGWKMNVLGNIAMFIPVGIVWPVCFKKLDTVGKTVLAGAGYSLLIELTQLLLFERNTDIDDLILNTAGVLIGALILFGCRSLARRGKESRDA